MPAILFNILIVAFGSGLGGVCRFLVSKLFATGAPSAFPLGTLVVNLGGCFLIGLIYGFIDRGFTLSPAMKLFLTVGFCGGFTTFSTFMNENFLLFRTGLTATFIIYAAVSFLFGLALLYVGYRLSN